MTRLVYPTTTFTTPRKRPKVRHRKEVSGLKPDGKEPSAEVEIQRRVRKLERITLILCIATVLLGLAGIRLAVVVGKTVGIFEFILEQLNFIGQQVDAVRQGIQGIQ